MRLLYLHPTVTYILVSVILSCWLQNPDRLKAIAAGTDALMIEVHPNPAKALSDEPQSLTPAKFDNLVQEMSVIGNAVGRWEQQRSLVAAV